MRIVRNILLVLLLLFIGIQFIRPKKNVSAVISLNDISRKYIVPPDVQTILAKACYDCHSNHTVYPWYNTIQPVAWWLNRHVNQGKRHLNFSEFTGMPVVRQYKRLNDCTEEVKEGDMPLNSYTWIHKNAVLTSAEKQTLYDWFSVVRNSIKSRYPDSVTVTAKE
jgi:hypothetical protein